MEMGDNFRTISIKLLDILKRWFISVSTRIKKIKVAGGGGAC